MTVDFRVQNPFPGIRSFEQHESHIFFGREKQIKEVSQNLLHSNFVALIGSSGCGKSSLVKAGVIPNLLNQKDSTPWCAQTIRPGKNPIYNLAKVLFDTQLQNNFPVDKRITIEKLIDVLTFDQFGLSTIIKAFNTQSKKKWLIIIDQFEEIFRLEKNKEPEDISQQFVKLLLNAKQFQQLGLYIMITMRSDFIDNCVKFEGLIDAINDGHYLVPKMNEDEVRKALTGPLQKSKTDFDPLLIDQLLTDVEKSIDPLPVMQHAMMRCWDYWKKNESSNKLSLDIYKKIGGIKDALSLHAEEIFNELETEELRSLAIKVFKSLTEPGKDNKGIRRPTSVKELSDICSTSEANIFHIVNHFRQPGREFLMPPHSTSINSDSIIDIAHESIMRDWKRLKQAVIEETESAEQYIRLSQKALLYQQGKSSLLVNPELQLALNWLDSQKPNQAWAKRYNPALENVLEFIKYSKKQYELELSALDKKQKNELRRTRIFALILGGATILSILFIIISLNLRIQSQASEKMALQKENLAKSALQKAEEQSKAAILQKKISEQQQSLTEQQRIITEEQKQFAISQQLQAIHQKQVALSEKQKAIIAEKSAKKQKKLAEEQGEVALKQKKIAESEKEKAKISEKKAQKLSRQAIAKTVAIQAAELQKTEDSDLPRLLALYSYQLNVNNEGNPYDPDIFDALLKNSNLQQTIRISQAAIRDLKIFNNLLFSCGNDGYLRIFDLETQKVTKELHIEKESGLGLRNLSISENGRLICANQKGLLYIFNKDYSSFQSIKAHSGNINDIKWLNANQFMTCSKDGTFKLWDINHLDQKKLIYSSEFEGLCILATNNQKKIYLSVANKNIYLYTPDNGKVEYLYTSLTGKATTMSFYDNESTILMGLNSGDMVIYNAESEEEKVFKAHSSIISKIQTTPNNQLVTCSFDGTVKIWNLKNIDSQPIIINNHDAWVYALVYDAGRNQIISGGLDKTTVLTPLSVDQYVTSICNNINEDLSESEWNRYFGKEIERIHICNK